MSALTVPTTAVVAQRPRSRVLGGWGWDLAIAAGAVLVRLPLIGAAARPDEAGYLLVAQHAHPGGRFLYGGLWVDRPPLLVAFFALAEALGGVSALRLLALVPVVVLVLAAASAGRTLAGVRGGRSAALVVAALSATPLLGAPEVDGEILAIPLVVVACALGLPVLLGAPGRPPPWDSRGRPVRHPLLVVAAAGATGTCAVLVKQNVVDALVLLAVLLAVRVLRGDLPRSQGLRLGSALVAGALVPVLVTLVWAAAWGSGPLGLWEPLFAFRSASLHVIAGQSTTAPLRRACALVVVAISSGLALVLVTFLVTSARRLRHAEPATAAVTAMVLAALPSIALGGSYWIHYLVQPVPAAALSAALLAGRTPPVRRWAAGLAVAVVASALVATAQRAPAALTTGCGDRATGAAAVSAWLAAHHRPGDTVVALYGGAAPLLGSGLAPAYPYLWSLPVRTLDPSLDALVAAVSGPRRATWVVQSVALHAWGLDPQGRLEDALAQGYEPVARICGHPVYLERGVSRPGTG